MNETKSHILQVALKLFLTKNFKEVTMKEIVEKSGLSKGAFYHYFISKEQLFAEIIDLFFNSILMARKDKIEGLSLFDYYNSNLNSMNDFSFFTEIGAKSPTDDLLSINFFALIFDALKLFPDFRKKMEDFHERELLNWSTVISNARANKEILSEMDNRQIARLFIFAGDGLTLNLTLKGDVSTMKDEIKLLWDTIYNSIRV